MRIHWQTLAIITAAIGVAIILGLWAGGLAGVLAAFAGIFPPLLIETALRRRENSIASERRRLDALRRFRLRRVPTATVSSDDDEEAVDRSVAQYLRPEEQLVSFRSRQERDQLYQWCIAKAHVGIRLVVGDAGVGKTRLAVQLAEDLKRRGWRDMWVQRGQEQDALSALRDVGEPAVLFVDYAETKTALIELLTDVANYEDDPDVRVVLLARSASEWWHQLIDNSEYQLRHMLLAKKPIFLNPLTTKAGQQEVYDDAIEAFSKELDVAPPQVSLSLTDKDNVFLVVHAAALIAVLDHQAGRKSTELRTANDVLANLLQHEAGYWLRTADARNLNLDGSVQRMAVAISTLIGAGNEGRAVKLLSNIPDLANSPERCRQVAHWLHDLYPGQRHGSSGRSGDWIVPLRPERVAEQFIVEELSQRPHLINGAFAGLSERRTLRALTTLANAAINDERAIDMLRDLLRSNLNLLAVPVVKVTVETNHALASVLNQLLQSRPVSVDLLQRMADVLPYPTLSLGHTGVIVFKRLADQSIGSQRAEWLLEVGRRLARLREIEDALTVTQEAIAIYQELVSTNADGSAAGLARSFNAKSVRLYQLRHFGEALSSVKEAIKIRRSLSEGDRYEHLSELAKYLNNESLYLAEMGRMGGGWVCIKESVELYRSLITNRPGLAMSLHSLSRYYAAQGSLSEALNAMDESISIHRELANAHPDMFSPQLASSLNNQAVRMARLGRKAESLVVIEESGGVEQDQVRDRPRPFLGDAQADSVLYDSEGRSATDSVATMDEALVIYKKLASDRPEIFLSDYATALNNTSLVSADAKKWEMAAQLAEEAVSIYRKIGWDRLGLAMALHAESRCMAELGYLDRALPLIEETVSIYRDQAEPHAGPVTYDLGLALNNMSMYLVELGMIDDDALEIIDEALLLHAACAEQSPDVYAPNLIISLRVKSRYLARRGHLQEAMTVIDEAVLLCRETLDKAVPIPVGLDEVLEERASLLAQMNIGDAGSIT